MLVMCCMLCIRNFINCTEMCDLYLLNATRAEGRSDYVPNSSPCIVLSKRHHVMKIARQNALKDTDA